MYVCCKNYLSVETMSSTDSVQPDTSIRFGELHLRLGSGMLDD